MAKKPTVEEMKQAIFKKNQAGLMKPSEVLGKHENKYLHLTEADRAKVENIKNGLRGGVGFSQIGLTNPEYAGRVWGVGKSGVITKLLNKEKRGLPDDAKSIWSTFIGSPDMHTSNQLVFNRMWNKFQEAKKAGLLTPELEEKMLTIMRSAMTKGKKNSPSKAIFDPDVALDDSHHLFDTFERRRILSDLMAGKKIGGKKAQIFDANKVIEESTDPRLLHAPTFSVGPHLFEFNRESSHEPHLNKAFPFMLHGTAHPEAFQQVPMEMIAPDYFNEIRQAKGRDPGYMDFVRNIPRQHITEAMLTKLQKAGYKDGGSTEPSIDQMNAALILRKADGGTVDITSVGANEAPDLDVKVAVPLGGDMNMGGVDLDPVQHGTQFMPTPQPQQGVPNQNAPQMENGFGQPQMPQHPNLVAGNQPPQINPPAMPPQPASNILQMTRQGQAMAALKPQAQSLPQMAQGGKVKGTMPNMDAMRLALTKTKKAK